MASEARGGNGRAIDGSGVLLHALKGDRRHCLGSCGTR